LSIRVEGNSSATRQAEAIQRILEGTAAETGQTFFRALVANLAGVLGTHGAWVTEYLEEEFRLRALAFWLGDDFVEHYEYDITGTPCERVVATKELIHIADDVTNLFPRDPDLKPMGAVGYMGAPLLSDEGHILGHLAVLDDKQLPHQEETEALFRIFAARALAELRRLRVERQLRQREDKLSRLIGSAMDAIVEVDSEYRISHLNQSAETVFGTDKSGLLGRDFRDLLTPAASGKLTQLIDEPKGRNGNRPYLWIPGGLKALRQGGENFTAEASLSCYELDRRHYFTLILRDIAARLEAEEKVRILADQTEYLKQELKEAHNPDGIVGRSPAIQQVLAQLRQVATTDTTVLLTGETGTGKELFARAIHDASSRAAQPLVKVNCAAIPATLIESEFFGHEKGAFTGATQPRKGRFTLADGGTIFLDEVGELPYDLQAKLLRVLQEGEFEPVGRSETRKVDVRVVVATNRNLEQVVRQGKFREDLFYRLNVFPIAVPPLRERGDDILLLAESIIAELSPRLGKHISPLNSQCSRQLLCYDWPGNVRELRNVIERAIITSSDGVLNFDHLMPASSAAPATGLEAESGTEAQIHTVAELQQIERDNLRRALELTDWRVSGPKGAAALLGVPPSTLSSRMKSLGLRRR
jgi:PAS domain S-box-containing protein